MLPDWYEDWVAFERERFRQLRAHALESLCDRLTAAGRFGEAIEAGLAAARIEPLRESAQRAIIRVAPRRGERGEALDQYRRFCKLLRNELGLRLRRSSKRSSQVSRRGDVLVTPPRA